MIRELLACLALLAVAFLLWVMCPVWLWATLSIYRDTGKPEFLVWAAWPVMGICYGGVLASLVYRNVIRGRS